MSIFSLAVRNLRGSGLRSLIIFLCVLGVAAFFISTTLIVRGAENSLQQGLQRLGADLLVVPAGAETRVETALLMGKPTELWMSADYLAKIARIPGVASVSPQIYLQSVYDAPCCTVSEMFLVVYDPATDFAVSPWLKKTLGRGLARGEVIGGSYISVPQGEKSIKLNSYDLTLKGNMEATGTGLDQTMFMTLETAQDMARSSITTAGRPLVIPAGEISSVMVKVQPGADAHKVALQILLDVAGAVPIESPNLFGAFRKQMLGLLWGFITLLSLAWVLSAILIALVFTMAANERRREIAVLRAIGATRHFIFQSILAEAGLLALLAGTLGIALASFGIYLFRDYIGGSLGMPFLFPPLPSLLGLFLVGMALSLITVTAAVFFPAFRISQQEPAVAMRE